MTKKNYLKTSLLILLAAGVVTTQAQNVGVGTTSPNSRLDVNGALSVREGQVLTLSNGGAAGGANDNISLPDISGSTGVKASFYRISGPTAAFSIYGIAPVSGADGQQLTLVNTTTQVMTIKNQASSTAANTIRTQSGADIVSASGGASITLLYNKTTAAWYVISTQNFVVPSSSLSSGSVTITPGTGISGGGTVALGGSVTVTNSGVTSLSGTTNQVNVSGSTGAITLSTPQNIHTGASPTFAGETLSGLSGGGLIKATSGTGALALATANTDYQSPLSGGTGITITSNVINSLWTANGTKIYNNNSGNVGIGTNAANAPLEVSANATDLAKLTSTTGGAGNKAYVAFQTFSGSSVNGRIGTIDMGTNNGSLVFETGNAGTASTVTTERMRILNGGNVGIGYTTPAYTLDVNGDIRGAVHRTTLGSGNILQVGDDAWIVDVNTANTVGIQGSSNSAVGQLQFGTNGAAYLYGTGANIGIKTTSMVQDLNVGGRMYLSNGVIQTGGTTTITATSDIGLYSQTSGSWIRFASNNAPIKFFTDQGGGNSAGTTDAFAIQNSGQLTVAGGTNIIEFQKFSCSSDNCGTTSFGGKTYAVANWLPAVVGFNGGSASGISLYYPFSAMWSNNGGNWQINLDYNGTGDGSNTKTVQIMFIRKEIAQVPSGSSFP